MKTVLHHYLLLCFLFLGHIAFGQDKGLNIANSEIEQLAEEKNYSPTDITGTIISDDYVSGGIRHIYYQQAINNIGVYGTSGAVHMKGDEIISSNLNFLPQADKRDIQSQFQVQAIEALARLAIDQGYPLSQTEVAILAADELAPDKNTLIKADGISNRVIPLKLIYFADPNAASIQLAWSVFIDEVADAEYKNYMVSATTGAVLFENNLTITCAFDHDHSEHQHRSIPGHTHQSTKQERTDQTDSLYNVLPFTIESPNFGNRTILANPWENPTASPNGWHHILGIDYEYTIGNNVDAYSDTDNTNDPTGANNARAFGGTDLVFDHPWDPNGTQANYTKAAITNLFYMNNVAHDIFYNYGFDEESGNFQEENYGNEGRGSDAVNAEAQDASGSCNANMATPGDGANPRMQMYLCGGKDGDYDNGVILHEYGHGISNRLTGGPQAVACLGNVEQMGEGWSDFFGMILTMKATDIATTNRTIGTFMFNQAANGAGLRPYPFTTDMTVNPMTYKTIDDEGITRPHGVGAVWATMLWDLNWALINQYGWDADMYNGTGGNNIALHLVMEGLKLQPCSPGFVDARDAILAADLALYSGVNRCLIWEVFARRGLGYSADQGSSNSRTDGSEGYDMPPECTIELKHSVDKTTAFLGERLTFQLEAINHLDAIAPNVIITDTLPENTQFYSASHGGVLNGNVVEWPPLTLPVGGTIVLELKVTINDTIDFDGDFLDDLESGGENWENVQKSGNHTWNLQSQYYYSPNNGWFITNANTTTETHLVLKNPLSLTDSSELSFNHYFDLEDRYDFGLVDISIDGGENWIDLENDFTQNGYNNYTQFGHYAYSKTSTEIVPNNNGFITSKADLSAYSGKVALVRFRLLSDINTAKFGWIVDDIGISNTNYALPNFSNIRNNEYDFDTQVQTPVIISQALINHTVETVADTLIAIENEPAVLADVQANDIDADGPLDTLITTIVQTATNGTATVINNDSVSYLPNTDFVGRDTVVYQVCDEANACETDTLFVFVEPANFAPITMTDFMTINQNTTNNFVNVQSNDSDLNGAADTLVTTIIQNAIHGTATVVQNEGINYTPIVGYTGLDTIIYQVCDIANLCAMDTVLITIIDINEAPTAEADFLEINKNTSDNLIAVQANDSDPDGTGDTLITSILVMPVNGTATVLNNKDISYTPTMIYFGVDTIIYQVCDTANLCAIDTVFITINDINDAPEANPDYRILLENTAVTFIDVQANDIDLNGIGDSLITTITLMPSNGTAVVINDDSISYSPDANYFGLDTIIYQVCDTASLCDRDTIFLTIEEINKAPAANPDFATIAVNSTTIIDVQANDIDLNGVGDSLITTILAMPLQGTATILNMDSISYHPAMGYIGLDTFVYQVCDTANLCATDTVFITIYDVNMAPTANADYSTVLQNSTNNIINVQANDIEPNGIGDSLITAILVMPSSGTAVVINGDSINYTPTASYFGLDTIVYQVCDTANLCATDTIFLTVNDVNEAPSAMEDFLVVDKNTNNNIIEVQANDSDPDGAGDSLITTILTPPNHGTVAVVNNDSLSYTPTMTYFGLDTIIYQVCDTANLCATDSVFITINDYNEAPVTNSDHLQILENTINNYIDVLANDTDPNGVGDTLTTVLVQGASNGLSVVVNGDSIRYTPTANFVGVDTIIYNACDTSTLCTMDTVFIEVEIEHFAPIANPDAIAINKNSQDVIIDVQANDYDPDGLGDTLTTTILSGAKNGMAGVVNGDSLMYTPSMDYFGLDTIIYQVCDTANLCDSDSIFITIIDVNEAPQANPDFRTVLENSTDNTINVQVNDTDSNGAGDSLLTSILVTAIHGTATVVNGEDINYSPTLNYFGLDTIIYQVCDTASLCDSDTLFLTIEEINKAPTANPDFDTIAVNSMNNIIAVQANDTDPNGVGDYLITTILAMPLNGTATVVNNEHINYNPIMGYVGLDTLVYQVCDTANVCATDTAFITIYNVNMAPTANADYSTVLQNSTNNIINVQANDNEPNGIGDSLITSILGMPLSGTAVVMNSDSISYTPILDYFGLDTIIYQVCDTANVCDADTVFMTIIDINEAPTAVADFLVINKNTSDNIIEVQANDSDPDGAGDSLITTILTPPNHGTAAVVNNDSLSYTPTMTYFGLDTIIYQVCDTANLCATDSVFITINDYNEAPVTNSDHLQIFENTINNYIDVLANDTDPNGTGDNLTTILVQGAANGSSVVVNGDSIRYTPMANFAGLDTIIYNACDTSNLCTMDTVFIAVAIEHLAPIAKTDFITINKNSQDVIIDVQANDYDPDGVGDTLTTTILSGAKNGIAGVVNGDSLIYTPSTDYFGLDTIIYQVCDTANLCASDTVFITIENVLLCAEDNLVKNDSGVVDGSYVAGNSVTSAGIINNGAKVKFIAGNTVTLLPGFHAKAGADFTARIEACNSVNSLNEASVERESHEEETFIGYPEHTIKQNSLLVRPNPFRGTTTIDYELATDSPVWIGLHDLTGKTLKVYVNQGEQMAGKHQYHLDAALLPSGAYWVSMRTANSVVTKKIIILQ